ncbi:MAG: division/cell wall cluster transcriptional repressor MraZ [Anaerolineae bacterium]|jgi:MraZ protein
MLLGEFLCRTDGDGRLTIPAEFQAELVAGATVTRGIERCLSVYPVAEWQRLVERMEKRLPVTSRQARAFRRLMFSAALTCVPDQRGQIGLPERLRQYADIQNEAVVVGLVSHVEIWSPGQWQKVDAALANDGVNLAEGLRDFGI